jgi:hypothetical protein
LGWRPLLGITLAVLFVVVWWLVPPLLYRHTGADAAARLKAITDTRTALFAGLIGVGALLSFWLNSRAYKLNSRAFEITAQTLKVTEQGQITERYTKAIEQLGSAKLDVRLGGIYALESIANDSTEDREYREHRTIVEVLSAFVREHSDPAHSDTEPSIAEVLSNLLRGDSEKAEPQANGGTEQQPKPAADVQAALTVLGQLPKRSGVPRGNLAGARLAGAILDRADLSGARLDRADLRRAELDGANLTRAWLTDEANLTRAVLDDANLAGARLASADLTGARLGGVDLTKTLGLMQAQLDATQGNSTTQLPAGLQRPVRWAAGDVSTAASP